MKNKWLVLAATAILGAFSTAQAVPIVGSIGFTGTDSQVGGTPGNLSTATSMTIVSVNTPNGTGVLAGPYTSYSFVTSIGVNGNAPSLVGLDLWSTVISGVTYNLLVSTSSQVFTSAGQLNLTGTGTLEDGNSADNTLGTWNLQFAVTGPSFTWGSTSGNTVPDGGATVILLGAALSGLGLLRKKLIA
ncbi:MAG TPA: hypothetical protein VIK53_07120 [Verrucomicrobiae bacterium]